MTTSTIIRCKRLAGEADGNGPACLHPHCDCPSIQVDATPASALVRLADLFDARAAQEEENAARATHPAAVAIQEANARTYRSCADTARLWK